MHGFETGDDIDLFPSWRAEDGKAKGVRAVRDKAVGIRVGGSAKGCIIRRDEIESAYRQLVSAGEITRSDIHASLSPCKRSSHVAAHGLGAAAYAIEAARAAAPDGEGESVRRLECRWQRELFPAAIRALVLDDNRLPNDICWSVFECRERVGAPARPNIPHSDWVAVPEDRLGMKTGSNGVASRAVAVSVTDPP